MKINCQTHIDGGLFFYFTVPRPTPSHSIYFVKIAPTRLVHNIIIYAPTNCVVVVIIVGAATDELKLNDTRLMETFRPRKRRKKPKLLAKVIYPLGRSAAVQRGFLFFKTELSLLLKIFLLANESICEIYTLCTSPRKPLPSPKINRQTQ